jgi:hypothetical protein
MLEYFAPGFLYSVCKDLWAYARGRRQRLKPEQILELRLKWKKEVEPILWERTQKKLRMDVIIRDIKRLDDYPDAKLEKPSRISAWFKVGLCSTYHNGIEVNLGWYGLVKDESGWRLPKQDENGQVTVAMVASIPYERIEKIDWTGDTFYGNSQVYCYFDGKGGTPYDDIFYGMLEQNPGGPMFYLKVASGEEVVHNSKRAGNWWRKPKTLRERLGFGPRSNAE